MTEHEIQCKYHLLNKAEQNYVQRQAYQMADPKGYKQPPEPKTDNRDQLEQLAEAASKLITQTGPTEKTGERQRLARLVLHQIKDSDLVVDLPGKPEVLCDNLTHEHITISGDQVIFGENFGTPHYNPQHATAVRIGYNLTKGTRTVRFLCPACAQLEEESLREAMAEALMS